MLLVAKESEEAKLSFDTLFVYITAVIDLRTTKMWHTEIESAANRPRVFSLKILPVIIDPK